MYNGYRCPPKAYLWSGVKTSTASDLAQWRRTQCALRAPVPHAANLYASNSTRAAEEGDASPSIDVITYKKDRIAGDDLSQETPHDNEDFELTRDPPSYDSGTPLSEVDANTMMDKIEVRTKWLQANGKARKFQEADQECSLATFPECDEPVASDKKCPRAMTVEIYKKDANMFRDKYGFYPHGETETELIRIWTKMERAAHKMCPSRETRRRLSYALSASRRPKLTKGDKALMNNILGEAHKRRLLSVADPWIRKLYNDVIEWRSQRSTSSIPRRHFFGDDEERRLAFRLQRARTPSSRAKFTKVDEGFINSISDIISIRSQITFKKARESARKAKESWKTAKENFQLTTESIRKAKATESLQKARRKRSEIRKAQSLWCARLLAVKKFQQQYSRLPVRNKRMTKCEQGLANWLDKAKQRKDRALSSRPSERQLTPTEAVQLKELFDAQDVLDRKTLVSITRSQNVRKKA